MGYTHYFEFGQPLSQVKFDAIKKDMQTIENHLGNDTVSKSGGDYYTEPVSLHDGSGEGDGVDYGANYFAFNGDDSLGLSHETLYLRVGQEGFDFCKTARKPYDLAVCLILICMEYHCGTAVDVSSDGGDEDWAYAKQLYKEIFPNR